MLKPIIVWYGHAQISNFYGWLQNRKIRECFLPRKFCAIQYNAELASAPGLSPALTKRQGPRKMRLVLSTHLKLYPLEILTSGLSNLHKLREREDR